ncbi:MAG: SDR family NAD(P)-dependent oxidoreductase [Patescibacteria group bacterium]
MKNKTVLITGGASGLGFELAKLFAADGYSLVLVSRNGSHLSSAKIELSNKYKISVEIIVADLTNCQAVNNVFPSLENKGIKIDILVNNAGFGLLGSFVNLDLQKQLAIIELDIKALVNLTYQFLGQAPDNSKILNISSMAAFQPGPNMNVYYAAKAFVSSFSEALAEELVERKIIVTALCPGPIDTNFWKVSSPGRENIAGTTALARLTPDFVARVGYQGLMRGRRVVIPGILNKFLAVIVKFVPRSLVTKGVKWLNSRI